MSKKMPIKDKRIKSIDDEVNKKEHAKEQSKDPVQEVLSKYVDKRAIEMQDYRKSLKVEKIWKDADKEYIPSDLDDVLKNPRKIFEADQETGLRSRMIPVGQDEENWRHKGSDPMLLVKIMSAMAVIIDKNPDSILTAMQKKYEGTSPLINALWKRSWEITNSKENLKLFVLNLCKYGWSVGRTYPKMMKYNKSVLDESDGTNRKYIDEERILYNDLCRETLDPRYVWIDEMTLPYNVLSMNDWYGEIELGYDQAMAMFPEDKYPDFKKYIKRTVSKRGDRQDDLKKDPTEEPEKKREDVVILGIYENRLKDLYVIRDVSSKAILYHSPLPNDDGMLSIWQTMWILRSSTSPYGISLWEIIKNDKQLFDKMSNMTMDQLVVSIMKMFFFTGTSSVLGDGKIKIKPGYGKQIINGDVKFLEVPGPGNEAWEGLRYLKSRSDDNSGITPTLEGEVTGKTLGEIIQAKEQALKRLKLPLENIADAIEQDAYISISWMSQIYSTPEVKEFANINQIVAYEEENQVKTGGVFPQFPEQEEGAEPQLDELGQPVEPQPSSYKAAFYPQLALHLEDSDGKLEESKESQFFQIGDKIKAGMLKWKGIFRVLPRSILAPSLELEKMRKMELFNIIVPLLSMPAEIYSKAVNQVIKVNEEDPEDWLPDAWMEGAKPSLFVPTAPQQQQPGQNPANKSEMPNIGQKPLSLPSATGMFNKRMA